MNEREERTGRVSWDEEGKRMSEMDGEKKVL